MSTFNKKPPLQISGDTDRSDHREGNDDCGQLRSLYNLFDKGQKAKLFANITAAMQGVLDSIVERRSGYFEKVHPNYAAGARSTLDNRQKTSRGSYPSWHFSR